MKKYCIGNEKLEVEEEKIVSLFYYILENEREDIGMIEYGVEIEKQDDFRIEKGRIIDITTDENRIKSIANLLMKNSVTPVHLHDIIEDMI